MRTRDFNNIMRELQKEDGKEYLEDYLQFMGWFFLGLTEKQINKAFKQIESMGYEVTNERWGDVTLPTIQLPNGIRICSLD